MNHAEVVGLRRARGDLHDVLAVDRLSGEELTVRGRVVLNAAGPWIDAIRRLESPREARLLGPTKGCHRPAQGGLPA